MCAFVIRNRNNSNLTNDMQITTLDSHIHSRMSNVRAKTQELIGFNGQYRRHSTYAILSIDDRLSIHLLFKFYVPI